MAEKSGSNYSKRMSTLKRSAQGETAPEGTAVSPDHHSVIGITLRRRLALHRLILLLSGLTLLFLSVACICIGAADISFTDVWRSIFAGITGSGRETLSLGTYAIVWDIRLPRVAMALIAGAALSSCGWACREFYETLS